MTTPTEPPGRDGALLRYRVMAWVTGVLLILLVFVGMPLKYGAEREGFYSAVALSHGWLYIVYVAVTLQLGLRQRWGIGRLLLVMLAGTVPFASFVAERKVVAQVRADSRVPAGSTG